jgi:hypothetical protein
MEVGGQRHASAALPPGKNRYPLYRRLGGPQGRSGRVGKISTPLGFGYHLDTCLDTAVSEIIVKISSDYLVCVTGVAVVKHLRM